MSFTYRGIEAEYKRYIITEEGKEVLKREYNRLKMQIEDGSELLGGE